MPIYEYRCQSCENTFEKLVKMNAEMPPCPECGADEVKKLVSASGFILKGSGWYKDHYGLKSGGSSGASSKGEATKSEGSSGSSGSSDAAPAASPNKPSQPTTPTKATKPTGSAGE